MIDADRIIVKRRSAAVAALLSLLLPGLGQGYATKWRRGIMVFLICAVADATLRGALRATTPSRAAFFLLLGITGILLGSRLFAIVDAGIQAHRIGYASLTRANRWWVYLLAIAGLRLVSLLPEDGLDESGRWTIYPTPTGSMEPTLQPGDYVIAWLGYYLQHEPRRGDLAVYVAPFDAKTVYVKRIVGLPGDHVALDANRLWVNGEPARREEIGRVAFRAGDGYPSEVGLAIRETPPGSGGYLILNLGNWGPLATMAEQEVPERKYLMLGDNRDISIDSRAPKHGLVPRANLRDRPLFVLWSKDWSRIGQVLE